MFLKIKMVLLHIPPAQFEKRTTGEKLYSKKPSTLLAPAIEQKPTTDTASPHRATAPYLTAVSVVYC